jgi:CHAD domain-containing protein
MTASLSCNDVLRTRALRLARLVARLEKGDRNAVHSARVAARRLREVVPLLQLEAETSRKVMSRLRRVTRRLSKPRDLDVAQALATSLARELRNHRDAFARVAEDLTAKRTRGRITHAVERAAADGRRAVKRLQRVLDKIDDVPISATRDRAVTWALKARVAHRAAAARRAVHGTGAVYLPERLHDARIALRKLRYGVELLGEVTRTSMAAELKPIVHAQDQLGHIRDAQSLVASARRLQGRLPAADEKVSLALDELVVALERRSRQWHAGYLETRQVLLASCERLVGRAPAASHRRRVS